MAVLKSKPTSPGRRHVVRVVSDDLHKGAPYGPLLENQTRNGGRNNNGRITTRHVGGGHKQHYRIIDFKRNKDAVPAKVERLEYDPNRTAHIALLLFADGERRYIIAPKGVKSGDVLQSGAAAPIKAGNCLPLRNIPVGSMLHCIELKPGKVRRLRVPLVPLFSLWRVKVNTPLCACAPVKCAKYWLIAEQHWARSLTQNTIYVS